ncbi:MAG: hypothetical protein WCI84_08800 [Bacteroidota bacterium]
MSFGFGGGEEKLDVVNIPWYLNWPFWTVVVAFVTAALSQIPPIRVLVKKAKIDLDIYSKIAITHKVGNPNLQLHLIVSNTGGRKIRIKNIEATIDKGGTTIIKLPVQNYLQNQLDQNTLLFTRFLLKPDDEVAHIINLLKFFDMEQERDYRKYENIAKSLQKNIRRNADPCDHFANVWSDKKSKI